MTREELDAKLKDLSITPHYSYFPTDGQKSDSFVVDKVGVIWRVYYFERGDSGPSTFFLTESEAFEYVFSEHFSMWERINEAKNRLNKQLP